MVNKKKRRAPKKQRHELDQKKQKQNRLAQDERIEILKDAASRKPNVDQNLNSRPIPAQGMRRGNR